MKIDGCAMHMFERPVDMTVRCVAPAASAAIVFFTPQIGTGASQ